MTPVLPDLLRPGLKLVICGSAAGTVSARRGAYYAGPGNKFWSVLAGTGLTPRLLRPDEFRLLPDFGIGLTDLAKQASGPDRNIRTSDYDADRLRSWIGACRPAFLAFNGKRAASMFLGTASNRLAYGHYRPSPECPPIVVLPSTSGAASGHWDPSHWHALAMCVNAIRCAASRCKA